MKELEILRIELQQWIEENPGSGLFGNIPNRSCWNCNEAHDRLKNVDYPIHCFDCGHVYFKGVKITED